MPPMPPAECSAASARRLLEVDSGPAGGQGASRPELSSTPFRTRAVAPDPDLAAVCAFARRRGLGPFRRRRQGPGARTRRLRPCRVRQPALPEAVLACADIAAVEALARDGLS